MAEELIKTLQEQIADGAEVVTFTIVLRKNYQVYTITTDTFGKEVFVDEV